MKLERHQLVGVLLTSMGTLALEVILTRIFSVTMWYHFAFLAISLALMGSAAAGLVLYLFPRLTEPEQARRWIVRLLLALACAIPLTFFLYLQIPFKPTLMNRTEWFSGVQVLWLALIYLDLALPFFLSGFVISLALSGWAAQAGKVYWADLTGASLGCLFSILALEAIGGVNALLAIGVVMALAGVAFSFGWPSLRAKLVPAGVLLGMLALVISNSVAPWLQIRVNKMGGDEPVPVYEKWNAHSRVTVYEEKNYPFFWSISSKMWDQTIAEGGTFPYSLLLIDSVAGTPIQKFDGYLNQVGFLRYDLTSFVYHMIERPDALVIGPGGGRDVLAALATGAPHVTAVEVNPAIVNAVRGPFSQFAGDLYSRDDVDVVVADARGYIDRSPARYDVIQASLIDTWAAGGSGAFALSENSLYTAEAFQTYYEHLSDRGYLSVSRWYLTGRPAETLRLIATGMAGWEAAGVADPALHIAVIANRTPGTSTEGLSTALFKRAPFTAEEVTRILAVAAELGYEVLYAPGVTPTEEVGEFVAGSDRTAFVRDYPLDISPATDNRPFFFNLILLGDLLDPSLSASGVYRTSMEAIVILFGVIGLSLLFGALLIGVLFRVSARRKDLARPSWALLGYFGALGLAFMLVEIPTIQKLTVYLGRPVYSLAVVLFSLLLFSGMGSLWSGGWREEDVPRRIRQIFGVLVVVVVLHTFLSALILKATLGLALGWRVVIAVLLLSILGFLMGIPFPTGVRWAGVRRPGVVPWLWGVNGVMSVLGSALATAVAIHIGFWGTLFIAASVYGIAGLLLARETRT